MIARPPLLGDGGEDAARQRQLARIAPTGRFVVAAPNVFGRLHVAPLMCAYLSKYPAVIGELTLADRLVNLIDDGIDAAVRIGGHEDVGSFQDVVADVSYFVECDTPPARGPFGH